MDTQQLMLYVHLYLVKLFGCMIADSNVTSIDLKAFGDAILNNKPHPEVYLAFGPAPAGVERDRPVNGKRRQAGSKPPMTCQVPKFYVLPRSSGAIEPATFG